MCRIPAAECQPVYCRIRYFPCDFVFCKVYLFILSHSGIIIQIRNTVLSVCLKRNRQILRRHYKTYPVILHIKFYCIIITFYFQSSITVFQCHFQFYFLSRLDSLFCDLFRIDKLIMFNSFSRCNVQLHFSKIHVQIYIFCIFPSGDSKSGTCTFSSVYRHFNRTLCAVKHTSGKRKIVNSVFILCKRFFLCPVFWCHAEFILILFTCTVQTDMIINLVLKPFKPADKQIICHFIFLCSRIHIITHHAIIRCHITEITDPRRRIL